MRIDKKNLIYNKCIFQLMFNVRVTSFQSATDQNIAVVHGFSRYTLYLHSVENVRRILNMTSENVILITNVHIR